MTEATNEDDFYANGINGSTGTYGLGPLTNAQFAELLRHEDEPDKEHKAALLERNLKSALMLEILQERLEMLEAELKRTQDEGEQRQLAQKIKVIKSAIEQRKVLAPREGIDSTDLAQTGWGIIFAQDADPKRVEDIKKALQPLLELRQKQAAKKSEKFFKIFDGPNGYRPKETYLQFLARHGAGPGPVDPKKGVPYYLLIIGSPGEIPFDFQYQLDVQFAVGRLDFGADLAAYERYARSVEAAETKQVKLPRTASFFGVSNPNDPATIKSAEHLITPLYNHFTTEAKQLGWTFEHVLPQEATKARLGQLLSGEHSPTVLFTASHGMEFNPTDSRFQPHQGALLCQNWPGPKRWREPTIPEKFYFAGTDLASQTNLLGMMTFHFACYGAGTPQFDDFDRLTDKAQPKKITEQPFVAELPKQLLRCGALASIGHVERAWGHSFFWPGAGEQLAVFESTLERLFKGHPIGSALEYFNERYAELATALTAELENVDFGARPDNLPNLWTGHNDARNYVIIGDPAARLPEAAADDVVTERPVIEVVSFAVTTPPAAPAASPASKPLSRLSDEDWQNTPPAVQEALREAVALLNQMQAQLATWKPE